MTQGFTLFETAVGTCGVVWGEHGLLGVHLPPIGPSDPRAKLARRFPEAVETAPPPSVQAAIAGIQALLRGERLDLMDIELDTQGVAPFNLRVYEIARAIPPGKTRTYGEIAREIGDVSVSRAVGQALGANPWPIVVPCHRVLAAGGGKGGFSAPGGTDTKMRMLEIEGALAPETLPLFGGL